MFEPMSYTLGFDQFVWFIGVVDDMTNDPAKLGRAKVRCIGIHTPDKDELPSHALPWAYPLAPITQAGMLPNYKVGDWVVGFFLDGELCQQPMLCWVMPSVPQTGGLLKKLVKTAVKSQTGL